MPSASSVLVNAGGAIADFLPHLASLAHGFVGGASGRAANWSKRLATSPLPFESFALVVAERGTAVLSFSARPAQPETFYVRARAARGCEPRPISSTAI